MSTRTRKPLIGLFAVVGILVVIGLCAIRGCSIQNDPAAFKKLPVTHIAGNPAIDVSDPAIAVAGADYVFAGYVKKMTGTQYANSAPSPYTNYQVHVLSVIKGNIKANQDLPLQKAGGISQDTLSVYVYDDDTLPDIGGTYIFMVYVQPDRKTLLVDGPYSNISLESTVTAAINSLESSNKRNKQVLIQNVLKTSQTFARYVEGKAQHATVPPLSKITSIYEGK